MYFLHKQNKDMIIYHKNVFCIPYKQYTSSCYLKVQYIPKNIYTVYALLCFVVVQLWLIWPIHIRVASLALGQSYDCPSASEVTLKDMSNLPV